MTSTTSLFTLHVPCPTRPTPTIQFEGIEYATLRQASEAVIGRYGFKVPMEIFGRAFVLTGDEAIRFSKHKLPFIMGIANAETYMTLPVNDDGPKSGVRWLPDGEAE